MIGKSQLHSPIAEGMSAFLLNFLLMWYDPTLAERTKQQPTHPKYDTLPSAQGVPVCMHLVQGTRMRSSVQIQLRTRWPLATFELADCIPL